MRKWVIISGIIFTIGNATWRYFGLEKLYWLPLGIFLWVMVFYIANNPKKASHPMKTGLYFLAALASGNIIKQAFYQDDMLQINDYIWGLAVFLFYLITLFKDWILYNFKLLWKWVIQNKRTGKNGRKG